jgi:hypothetical protein
MKRFKAWLSRRRDLKAYRVALSNFTYKKDRWDEWTRFDRTDQPFSGDCEDLAFTLQKQIGGEVRFCRVGGKGHAVLLKDGVVFDQFGAVKKQHYLGTILYVMHFEDKNTTVSKRNATA